MPVKKHQIHKEKQPPPRSTAARWITYVLAGIGFAVFAISLWNSIGRNLDFPWTSIRLAPAFALAHGYPLYSMPDQPPWVMVGYGPLYPVAYLPSVLAHDPRSAVAAATVLAHLFILVPAGLIFSLLGKRLAGDLPVHWLFFWLFFALVTHLAPSLVYVTAGVHADAPAFGLFLLACYAVLRAEGAAEASQTRWLLGAGIAAGLSAACKLNLAAGMVALLVWTLRFFGWKRAATFLFASALAALAVYSWAALRDGLAPVLLNLGQPAKMPWFTFRETELASLSGSSHEFPEKFRTFLIFGRDYLKTYGAIALAVILIGFFPRESAETDRTRRLVRFFLFLSLFLMPASIASISKYGGDVNSRALVSLPLGAGRAFRARERGSAGPPQRNRGDVCRAGRRDLHGRAPAERWMGEALHHTDFGRGPCGDLGRSRTLVFSLRSPGSPVGRRQISAEHGRRLFLRRLWFPDRRERLSVSPPRESALHRDSPNGRRMGCRRDTPPLVRLQQTSPRTELRTPPRLLRAVKKRSGRIEAAEPAAEDETKTTRL